MSTQREALLTNEVLVLSNKKTVLEDKVSFLSERNALLESEVRSLNLTVSHLEAKLFARDHASVRLSAQAVDEMRKHICPQSHPYLPPDPAPDTFVSVGLVTAAMVQTLLLAGILALLVFGHGMHP